MSFKRVTTLNFSPSRILICNNCKEKLHMTCRAHTYNFRPPESSHYYILSIFTPNTPFTFDSKCMFNSFEYSFKSSKRSMFK